MSEEQSFVRITNREIYDSLNRLDRSVSKLEDRVDAVLKENITNQRRIRSLELRFYGILAGLVAALTALGVGLGTGG